MQINKLLFTVARALLKYSILSAIFVGSLAGLAALFSWSPHFLAEGIDEAAAQRDGHFFVAFVAEDEAGKEVIKALPYRALRESPSISSMVKSFRLKEGKSSVYVPPGDGSIIVNSSTDSRNIQTITVDVVGDTPWTSHSEYEVHGESIHPRKLGMGSGWLLFATFIIPLILVFALRKPAAQVARKVIPDRGQTD